MCLLSVVYIVVLSFNYCTNKRGDLEYKEDLLKCFNNGFKIGAIMDKTSLKGESAKKSLLF